ncbi:MICAL-like protein 1 isoform X1 [Silurus asotus]|uniref:MICAL-like protein 1 isoform X1 n=1 Tax=Silurus asotus TaxID=30991 RepID=A0AAD5AC82_SILAS|nr:MICAL-like protein 1 isoform X1 [Silurus asotus]
MGSLKALQEWCRVQCEGYNDVDIRNMAASFRDGLAFCALIHKHRPDLIDFDSLSKENVYENNQLAFELAETELGIPALLDAEDMVSMKVPDRLSIITYVSQYYNFFTNKSQANPPCMKRPGSSGHIEPAIKKPTPLEDKTTTSESNADSQSKRSNLSSTCAACEKHVHLVQRFLVDGKLYHRNCFRCMECSSTLLPGSYKLVGDAGSLVCTHHFARIPGTQNGRSDLSKQISPVSPGASPESPPSGGSLEKTLPDYSDANEHTAADDKSRETHSPERESWQKEKGGEEIKEELQDSAREQLERRTPSPPNPFDESDEEELKEEEQPKPATEVTNGDRPPTPVRSTTGANRPVPAPRKVSDPCPSPRPVPRPRPPRPLQTPAVSENAGDRRPVPRERSQSPASSIKSSDSSKPKDPPWLALVKQESKKKLAPPPPRPVVAPQFSTSTPAKIEEQTRPAAPPNPFDDENGEEAETEYSEAPVPSSVVAVHPWYGISPTAEVESPAHSENPRSGRSKKRPAPRVPKSVPTALPSSQSSSACPSPALSTDSLSSSSSEHGFPRTAAPAVSQRPSCTEQEHVFTKSVSEPSISSPGSSPSAFSSEPKSHISPSPSPSQPHSNTCSAPATPETNRSAGSKVMRPPPPRPPAAPSPLIGSPSSQQNTPNKRVNPFNRKASSTVTSPQSRPPKGSRPARPPAPGHGFPLIKRRVQSDQYIPVEDIHVEMVTLEKQLDELEQRGVELEQKLRGCSNEEEEERLLVDWFTLIHEKHLLVRREAELVYTVKQQNLEERQADVEYELRCLLNKPEKEWNDEDRDREKQLMDELVTIIEQRNQIINSMDQDRQREEEEDKLVAAMLKKKEFHGESEHKKKAAKFKPMKVLKRLSTKGDVAKSPSPRKEKS